MNTNITNMTKEEQEYVANLIRKDKARKDYHKRQSVKNLLYIKKAKEMGLEVSDEEIEEYLLKQA